MWMFDTSFKHLSPSLSRMFTRFVSDIMHGRLWTGYVCVSMKYSCWSTQNSEEYEAQTAPQQTKEKPLRKHSEGEKRSEREKRIHKIIFLAVRKIRYRIQAIILRKDIGEWILFLTCKSVHIYKTSHLILSTYTYSHTACCGASWVFF